MVGTERVDDGMWSPVEGRMLSLVLEQAHLELAHREPEILTELGGRRHDRAETVDESAVTLQELKRLLPGLPGRTHELLLALSAGLSSPGPDAGNHDDLSLQDEPLLQGADATLELGRFCEAAQLRLLASMATRVGSMLLRREHGESDPAELSKTARARWRARTKSAVASEFQALSGFGIQDCHDRVGFASAPPEATTPAREALESGRADWWQVWQWWKGCRDLELGLAADVAATVFTAPETGEDDMRARRRSRREFMDLLELEVTRVEGADQVAARERRHRAVKNRAARASVSNEGTGCLRVTGRTTAVVAAMERLNSIARRARSGGDTRSLDQLRSDAALALLLAGNVPGPPEFEPQVHTDDHPADDLGGDDLVQPAAGGGWAPADLDRLSAVLAGHAPAVAEVVVPYDVLTGANPDGVALLTGHGYLTGEHARELLLTPGSSFFRLVTDPATGTLVDRSVDRYQPDALMRAVVAAVDRYCRGPGCTVPARDSELDHVLEYPEGPTALSNLAAEHGRHHDGKTRRWWACVMDPTSRVVEWTSLLGRVYTTCPFDYRRLARARASTAADGTSGSGSWVWADVQDQVVYAALAERAGWSTLSGSEDEVDLGRDVWAPRVADLVGGDGPVSLVHVSSVGDVRPGAPPRQPNAGQVVTDLIGEAQWEEPHEDRAGDDHIEAANPDEPPPPF